MDALKVTSERTGKLIVDTFYTQWLLGLGEFEMLDSADESAVQSKSVKLLLWFYFFLATLVSQLVMFNTLIAILGDTYSRIMEKRVHYALKAKTEVYADFMYQIEMIGFNDFLNQPYLYVIRPDDEEDDNQEWEGAVSILRRQIEKFRN